MYSVVPPLMLSRMWLSSDCFEWCYVQGPSLLPAAHTRREFLLYARVRTLGMALERMPLPIALQSNSVHPGIRGDAIANCCATKQLSASRCCRTSWHCPDGDVIVGGGTGTWAIKMRSLHVQPPCASMAEESYLQCQPHCCWSDQWRLFPCALCAAPVFMFRHSLGTLLMVEEVPCGFFVGVLCAFR